MAEDLRINYRLNQCILISDNFNKFATMMINVGSLLQRANIGQADSLCKGGYGQYGETVYFCLFGQVDSRVFNPPNGIHLSCPDILCDSAIPPDNLA